MVTSNIEPMIYVGIWLQKKIGFSTHKKERTDKALKAIGWINTTVAMNKNMGWKDEKSCGLPKAGLPLHSERKWTPGTEHMTVSEPSTNG